MHKLAGHQREAGRVIARMWANITAQQSYHNYSTHTATVTIPYTVVCTHAQCVYTCTCTCNRIHLTALS